MTCRCLSLPMMMIKTWSLHTPLCHPQIPLQLHPRSSVGPVAGLVAPGADGLHAGLSLDQPIPPHRLHWRAMQGLTNGQQKTCSIYLCSDRSPLRPDRPMNGPVQDSLQLAFRIGLMKLKQLTRDRFVKELRR